MRETLGLGVSPPYSHLNTPPIYYIIATMYPSFF